MREGFPSVTAAFVAFARGVASNPGIGSPPFRDDVARHLVPFPLGPIVPRRGAVGAKVAQALIRGLSLGLVDHLAMRSHAIDAAVDAAMAAGIDQLVLLGAGLDARAHRLDSLQNAGVFEVDHPASQGYKKRRAAGLARLSRELSYVPQDFTKETLDETLGRAGHDPKRRTMWVCEGVTMYLAPSDTRALLATLRRLSAPGSRLAVTYMEADRHPVPKPFRSLAELPLAVFGEPFRGSFSRTEIAEAATHESFRVLSDESSRAWAKRHGGISAAVFRSERLLVIERDGDPKT
jgi:methyltransferase (TIGR00027 family)